MVYKPVEPELKAKYNLDYYSKHKERILTNNKLKFSCVCGSVIAMSSKSRHLNSSRHFNNMHRNEICNKVIEEEEQKKMNA